MQIPPLENGFGMTALERFAQKVYSPLTPSATPKEQAYAPRNLYNPPHDMGHVAENLRQSFLRVFPDCVALGQAVAFNMFLAFFPMILFALGILSSMALFQDVVRDLPAQIQNMLPEGSSSIVLDYFVRRTAHPWQWIWLGFGGTLIAGTQVFIGLIQGFRQIDKLPSAPSYLRIQLRAAIILCLTIIPFLAFEIVTIFGRPVRHWMLANYGLGPWVRILAAAAYHGLAMIFALGVVFVIYRLGQPDMEGLARRFPRRRGSHHPLVDRRHRLRFLRPLRPLRHRLPWPGRSNRLAPLDVSNRHGNFHWRSLQRRNPRRPLHQRHRSKIHVNGRRPPPNVGAALYAGPPLEPILRFAMQRRNQSHRCFATSAAIPKNCYNEIVGQPQSRHGGATPMNEIHVLCYSGYRPNERPQKFK